MPPTDVSSAHPAGQAPPPPRLVLRPSTVEEAVALIEAAAASGAHVLVTDLPLGGTS